jgi:hypothetical protein
MVNKLFFRNTSPELCSHTQKSRGTGGIRTDSFHAGLSGKSMSSLRRYNFHSLFVGCREKYHLQRAKAPKELLQPISNITDRFKNDTVTVDVCDFHRRKCTRSFDKVGMVPKCCRQAERRLMCHGKRRILLGKFGNDLDETKLGFRKGTKGISLAFYPIICSALSAIYLLDETPNKTRKNRK